MMPPTELLVPLGRTVAAVLGRDPGSKGLLASAFGASPTLAALMTAAPMRDQRKSRCMTSSEDGATWAWYAG